MTVGLLTLELYLPLSQSLKDKRMVLRRLKDRVGAMNVSVAEVAHQDLWQRAGLGIVTVASSDIGVPMSATSNDSPIVPAAAKVSRVAAA